MTNCLHIFSSQYHPFLHLVPSTSRLTGIPYFTGYHRHRLTVIGVRDQLLDRPPLTAGEPFSINLSLTSRGGREVVVPPPPPPSPNHRNLHKSAYELLPSFSMQFQSSRAFKIEKMVEIRDPQNDKNDQ